MILYGYGWWDWTLAFLFLGVEIMDQVHRTMIIYCGHGNDSPESSGFWNLDRERHQTNPSIFAYTMYPGVIRTAHHERRGGAGHVRGWPCGFSWLAEFGVWSLEDEGERTEADRKADVWWLLVVVVGGPTRPQVGKNCTMYK